MSKGWLRATWRTFGSPKLVQKIAGSAGRHIRQRINRSLGNRIIRHRHLALIDTPRLLEEKAVRRIRTVAGNEEVEVPPTTRLEPPTNFDLERTGVFLADTPWALELEDTLTCGPLSTVFTAQGEIILESHCPLNYQSRWVVPYAALRSHRAAQRQRPVLEHETTVPLTGYWATSYFHWIIEHLSKLLLLPKLGYDPASVQLLTPKNPPAWLLDSLRLVGYSPNSLLPWPADRPLRSRRTIVLSSPRFRPAGARFTLLRRSMIRALREKISPKPPGPRPRRIYVTRSSSPGRTAGNENAVRSALADRGFETFDPGGLTLSQQIESFASARTIVGLHGAGLTNSVFAYDANVIELHGDTQRTGNYRYIAAALGHRYGALRCRNLQTLHPSRPDLWVDTEKLAALVDIMDEGRPVADD